MSGILEQLAAGARVLTGTHRLSRLLRERYAEWQMERGNRAWPTPDTASWDEWALAEWRGLGRHDPLAGARVVLDEQQEIQLWDRAIRGVTGPDPEYVLLHTSATARAAKETWQLLQEWNISFGLLEQSPVEDTRVFVQWAAAFRQHKEHNDWLSACELNRELAAALRRGSWHPGGRILLAGFDDWVPAQRDLLEALQDAGVDIQHVPLPRVNRRAETLACTDRRAEFQSAAHWCRRLLESGSPGPIGVIVDDLERSRDQVEVIFDQVLHAASSLSHETDRERAFHISFGRPLSEYAVIEAALALLGLIAGPRPLEEWTRILHSPFTAGAVAGSSVRARLDLDLKQRRWERASLNGLLRHVERHHAADAALTRSLEQSVRYPLPERESPSAWTGVFIEWLSLFGWPGERTLSSMEYQTVRAWRELLGAFARTHVIDPEIDTAAALERLGQMARRRIFQLRSEGAPVQIMGVREASGMSFSDLWITGMSDDVWPAPPRPNPFLPFDLQRSHKLPGAVAACELERHARITARLIDSAERLTVSYPRQREDQVLELSGLFRSLPASGGKPETWDLIGLAGRDGPALERLNDANGPALGDERLHGGASIWRDQAVCPFRAFAHHRLRASGMPELEPGLNAAERGILVHASMAGIWREIRTWGRLRDLRERAVDDIVARHVDLALARIARRDSSRFRERVLELERQRLCDLARDWLSVELDRPPFEVEQVEHRIQTRFSGIDVSLRVDRIDRLASGHSAIIDYKTGRTVSVEHWLGDRPDDPQLPLYLLVLGDDVGVLVFAQLQRGGGGFKGYSAEVHFAEGVVVLSDWLEQKQKWQRVLERLAKQFIAGAASVDPKSPSVCRSCDVMALCRIFDGGQESDIGRE